MKFDTLYQKRPLVQRLQSSQRGIPLPRADEQNRDMMQRYDIATFRVKRNRDKCAYHIVYRNNVGIMEERCVWFISQKPLEKDCFSIPLCSTSLEVFAVVLNQKKRTFRRLKITLLAISELATEGIEQNPGYPNPDPDPNDGW